MAIADTLADGLVLLDAIPPVIPDDPCVGKVLKVNVQPQEQDNWCWAAVAVGIVDAYEGVRVPPLRQCTVAKIANGGASCCPGGTVAGCDRTHTLPPALKSHFDKEVPPEIARTFDFVKERIDEGIPIVARVAFPNVQSGHCVVISGYCVIGMTKHLYVCDPLIGHRVREAFDVFLENYRDHGGWKNTYLTKGANGARKVREDI